MEEFVSVDGFIEKDNSYALRLLQHSESERPIVAQLFGNDPKKFHEATKIIKELGFDGVDINMGCPSRNVLKNIYGAGLINHKDLAAEIISACKDVDSEFPVSVKTRIGYYDRDEFEDWIKTLLNAQPDAISIHLRTAKELSLVPAHWEQSIFDIALHERDKNNFKTLIIGNGDVNNLEEAKKKANAFHLDGVMIGRSAIGQPWFWNEKQNKDVNSVEWRLSITIAYIDHYQKEHETDHCSHQLKKQLTEYHLVGFDGVRNLRNEINDVNSCEKIKKIILNFLKEKPNLQIHYYNFPVANE